jgi:CheY-like chemotaxis protein
MTARPYVLLVEDDLDISESIQAILEEENYQVQCKFNGKEAMEYLMNAEVEPSLILLDVMMPLMNGYQFREAQLKNSRISNIPTIILSASNELQNGEQFHFTDFIKKPLDVETLLDAIKNNILH